MDDVRAAARLALLGDTSAEAERQRLAAIRQTAPTRRLRQALDLSDVAREFGLRRLRAIHSGRTDLELVEVMLGRPLVAGQPVPRGP